MLLLDPNLPVLTNLGYIPAKLINPGIKLISEDLNLVTVKSVECITADLRYASLKWKNGAFAFRFPECVYVSVDDPCKFCPPEILSLGEQVVLKFGVDPSLFAVSDFVNIENVFLKLLTLQLQSLQKLKRLGWHPLIDLDARLLHVQLYPLTEKSKFLRGLLKLPIDRRKELLLKLPEVAAEYSGNLKFVGLPQVYDVYNVREFCGRVGFFPSVASWRNGKCGILFKEVQLATPDFYTLRARVSLAKIFHDPQEWISINCDTEKGILAAALTVRAA